MPYNTNNLPDMTREQAKKQLVEIYKDLDRQVLLDCTELYIPYDEAKRKYEDGMGSIASEIQGGRIGDRAEHIAELFICRREKLAKKHKKHIPSTGYNALFTDNEESITGIGNKEAFLSQLPSSKVKQSTKSKAVDAVNMVTKSHDKNNPKSEKKVFFMKQQGRKNR